MEERQEMNMIGSFVINYYLRQNQKQQVREGQDNDAISSGYSASIMPSSFRLLSMKMFEMRSVLQIPS